MLRSTQACLTLAALATTASAQGSVKDDSMWTDGNGTTVTVDVTERDDGKVDVTFTDHTGFSHPVTGNRGQGQTPSTTYTPVTTIWQGENQYRVRDPSTITPCRVELREPGGHWKPLKPVKKKTKGKPPSPRAEAGGGIGIDEEGNSLPGGAPPKPL